MESANPLLVGATTVCGVMHSVMTQLSRNAEVTAQAPFAGLTTLRAGGPAAWLVRCITMDAIVTTVRDLDAAGQPLLIVGGGSNLLVADSGFDGVALRIANAGIEFGADSVIAEAGADWDAVVAATVDAGFGGLECLSGIPGSAGATPVGNVGAYGVEVASLLRRVRLLERATGEVRWAEPAELEFAYRTSALKHNDRAVVLAAEFGLQADGLSEPIRYAELAAALGVSPGERVPAVRARETVLRLRRGKGMLLDEADHDTWSLGSFFTNPVVAEAKIAEVDSRAKAVADTSPMPKYPAPDGVKLSAGWLIERAGFGKGYPGEGAPARLSTKHTLALTNRGTARAGDIVALAREVREGVHTAFGVWLEPEPVLVGLTL